MKKFMREMEAGFGYTVQRKKTGTKVTIHRGSKVQKDKEILFHGTERSCKIFKNERK